MPRVKIPDALQLKSWGEVNSALKGIAQAEIELTKIEGDLNEQINAAKDAAAMAAAPLQRQLDNLAKQVKQFADLHREEFGKAKSKRLTFGEIGWRASSSISLPKDQAQVIEHLRKNGMEDCIKSKESINRDQLKQYPETEIIRCGATVKHKDEFWLETDKQQLADG